MVTTEAHRVSILNAIGDRAPAALKPFMPAFSERFLTSLSDDDIARFDVDDLVGAVLFAFDHFAVKPLPSFDLLNPGFADFGWQSEHTVMVLHHADIPFLVDTLRIELARLSIEVHTQVNLVLSTKRDATGMLVGVARLDESPHAQRESLIWLEIDRQPESDQLRQIKAALQQVLVDLRLVVADFPAMQSVCREIADRLGQHAEVVDGATEAADFVRWLIEDQFTFLGIEYYQVAEDGALTGQPARALGVSKLGALTDSVHSRVSRCVAPSSLEDLIVFAKAPVRSRIHRAAYPDVVAILDCDESGQVFGEFRLIGLYTARVYLQVISEIPVVRAKVATVVARSGFFPGTHNYKQLMQILQVYPRDDLFQSSTERLVEHSLEIVKLHERRRVKLLLNRDPFGFFCSALLFIPRDLYTTESRLAIQRLLSDALHADDASFSTYFSESIFARVQMIFRLQPDAPIPDVRELERAVTESVTSWSDQLRAALDAELGDERANSLFARYGFAFPAGYREDFKPRRAVYDIGHAEALSGDQAIGVSLYQPIESGLSELRLKLFSLGQPVPLSDSLPLMEDLGARVLSDTSYQVRAKDRLVWIHDYRIDLPGALDVAEIREAFQAAFISAWHRASESDGLCRLVVLANLAWRDVALIRALCRYLKQIGFELSPDWMADALVAYPVLARDLVALFYARFDPSKKRRDAVEDKIAERIVQALDRVEGLNEDRFFRRMLECIRAIVRTNFFQKVGRTYRDYFSFKLTPASISEMPKPIPMFEIFVYSPRVEGVHLRGGPVARGGLRWSDRGEDYRTEVLGLVKAQQVKNSMIVPVGAKGGFFPKALPLGDRDAIQAEAIACYELFISGLLDVTDNLVHGEIVSPKDTRLHDQPDPYLVVAADKGTATFSDIANRLSEARGFWLGDAFASGGSAGYDHRKMGITARGAWVSVQHHFRALGRNCQTEAFTAVGIGDMGGDVFGNGMMCSPMTHLLAAFNHQHIFLDPSPDPIKSFAERTRLFHLPRSSWADYDPTLLSAGGGVFSRSAKHIMMSPEAASALAIEPGQYTPNQVLSAILRAPVDLLFNGGIGTYVKASSETHLDVGDKANDAIRVNADTLRCRIIAEGGNLGCTQRGRMEAFAQGVLVNTDFIDNAAGVDCSDREVNIKIHMNQVVASGELTRKQRDRILESMTEEVAALVLANNDRQAQAVSLSLAHGMDSPDDLLRFMQTLSQAGRLDRELEFLPSDEVFHERLANGQPLTRPEICILISYAKNDLKAIFRTDGLLSDQVLREKALAAFPPALVATDREGLVSHQLILEIAATQWANEIVNLMGVTFIHRMEEASGRDPLTILKAYAVASAVYGFESHWLALEAARERLPEATVINLMRQLHRLVRRATRWILRNRRLDQSVADEIGHFQSAMQELIQEGASVLPLEAQASIQTQVASWVEQGLEPSTAAALAVGHAYNQLISIAEVAMEHQRPLMEVAAIFVALGETLGLNRFAQRINAIEVHSNWEALAREAFRDDLNATQQRMADALSNADGDPAALVQGMIDGHQEALDRWLTLLAQIEHAFQLSYPMVSVAMRELKALELEVCRD